MCSILSCLQTKSKAKTQRQFHQHSSYFRIRCFRQLFILLSLKLQPTRRESQYSSECVPCFLSRHFFPAFCSLPLLSTTCYLNLDLPPIRVFLRLRYLFTFFILWHKQNELWAKMQFNLNRNESADLEKYNFKIKAVFSTRIK